MNAARARWDRHPRRLTRPSAPKMDARQLPIGAGVRTSGSSVTTTEPGAEVSLHEAPDVDARCRHRALHVVSPTLEELRNASTPEALAVWNAASSLSFWRNQNEEHLRSLWAEHHAEPAAPPVPPSFDEPGINGIDLARALVAHHSGSLPGLNLAAASELWRTRVGDGRVDRLSYTWARRWAYLAFDSIGIEELFRSIPGRARTALARLDDRFQEGLITEEEASNHLVDKLGSAGRYGGDVPPACLWRPCFPRLELSAPGHVLIGPTLAGKRTFLSQLKAHFHERGINIDNFHGGGFPDPKYKARPEATYAAVSPGLVCVWTYAHRLEPALLRYALEMAGDPEADFHLILSATADEWAEILAMAPRASTLRIVPFEPLPEEDLVAIWLCQRPMLEDHSGRRLDLGWLIARLGHLRRYDSPSAILRRFLPTRDAAGSLVINDDDLRGPTEPLRRRPLSASNHDRIVRRDGGWLLPLLPTPEHFSRAVALDEAITGTGRTRSDPRR